MGNDTHIWDVSKLLASAADIAPKNVPLEAIEEQPEAYWGQRCDDSEHEKLIDAADLAFPILLDPEGRLLDGMHRVAKARANGLAYIPARMLRELPAPDFVNVDENDLDYS